MNRVYYFVAFMISFRSETGVNTVLNGNMEIYFNEKNIESIEDINEAQTTITERLKKDNIVPKDSTSVATITNYIFLRNEIVYA